MLIEKTRRDASKASLGEISLQLEIVERIGRRTKKRGCKDVYKYEVEVESWPTTSRWAPGKKGGVVLGTARASELRVGESRVE